MRQKGLFLAFFKVAAYIAVQIILWETHKIINNETQNYEQILLEALPSHTVH